MKNHLIANIIKEIRSSIEKNQIEKALNVLKELVETIENETYSNEAILLSSSFQRFKNNGHLGLEIQESERNRILIGILELLTKIEKDNQKIKHTSLSTSYSPSSELKCYLDEFIEISKRNLKFKKDEHEKLYAMKIKLYELLFSEIDEKIIHVSENKQQHVKILFDRVLFSNNQENKLTPIDYSAIQKIRESEEFSWYNRSVIVSALTISTLNGKVLDLKKLNSLIDFLSDFEPDIWEKSLVGIVLILYKWDSKLNLKKYSKTKNRLTKLKEIPQIQESLKLIEYELRNYRYNMSYESSVTKQLTEKLKNRTYPFWQQPHNWFLPFFRENPIIESILLTTKHRIEGLERLQDLLTHSYLSNAEKYSFCLELESFQTNELKSYIESLISHNKSCNYNHSFQIILTDIFQFYTKFPKLSFYNMLQKQVQVHESNFLSFIANEDNENKIRAEGFFASHNLDKALDSYEKIMLSSPNDYHAKRRVIYISMKSDQYDKALSNLKTIKGRKVEDWDRIMKGICYASLEKYKRALVEFHKVKDKEEFDDWNFKVGNCYFELEDYDEALQYYNNQLEKENHVASYCRGGSTLEALERYEDAIEFHTMALKYDSQHEHSFIAIKSCYEQLENEKMVLKWERKHQKFKKENTTANK